MLGSGRATNYFLQWVLAVVPGSKAGREGGRERERGGGGEGEYGPKGAETISMD